MPQSIEVGRRSFVLGALALGAIMAACGTETPITSVPVPKGAGFPVEEVLADEHVFGWLDRVHGGFDPTKYRQVLGAANAFKEGDAGLGVAADSDASRQNARALLAATSIATFLAHPVFEDDVSAFIDAAVDPAALETVKGMTFGQLKAFLLDKAEADIKGIMPGLPSDVISNVVKLMSNDELVLVGQKVFNPLPGSNIGAKGYMGARVQPNSPTDDTDDIVMQVFDAFSYGVGDVVLGCNPVSSEVESVAAVELALKDVLDAFGLADTMPHCVLAHIDVQAAAEELHPGATALWFQSLGGVADANKVFDIDVAKMKTHAAKRTGEYGLYFETGQGADATNGQGKGFDIVMHESRKYGFARALAREVAAARSAAGHPGQPWVHVNDVAGFIGPEVFRTKEQLVRCCLEDTVMGKLHGIAIGLDICSTLHMDVALDDLDWCIDQIMPVNPAYLMALPTKNDPMLSYLTTAFQDHVRIRNKFGYKVNDKMWAFYQKLGVIDADGNPTEHFGDPTWVYLQYSRAKNDPRPDEAILAEAREKIAQIRGRGVSIAEGHGAKPWNLDAELDKHVHVQYEDAKKCIFAELPADFAASVGNAVAVVSQSRDRADYILHPPSGEVLTDASVADLGQLRAHQAGKVDVQIVLSDGLDAYALTDPGHLPPFLAGIRDQLGKAGLSVAAEHVIVTTGRVRAGYRIGEMLFAQLPAEKPAAILHVIGERPGNGHHTYSVYITRVSAGQWAKGGIDHQNTKVVANIADTAFDPEMAATETVKILGRI
jgi:ethanolamine ammonia-lyase large subunit